MKRLFRKGGGAGAGPTSSACPANPRDRSRPPSLLRLPTCAGGVSTSGPQLSLLPGRPQRAPTAAEPGPRAATLLACIPPLRVPVPRLPELCLPTPSSQAYRGAPQPTHQSGVHGHGPGAFPYPPCLSLVPGPWSRPLRKPTVQRERQCAWANPCPSPAVPRPDPARPPPAESQLSPS